MDEVLGRVFCLVDDKIEQLGSLIILFFTQLNHIVLVFGFPNPTIWDLDS